MATKTQAQATSVDSKDKTPFGTEFHGFITVARAAAIANVKVSTVNYWLREGLVEGFRLESEERNPGEEKDRSAFLLVDRKSLQAWLDGGSQREAIKEAARLARLQEEEELKAIRAQEEELKRKRAEIAAKKAAAIEATKGAAKKS